MLHFGVIDGRAPPTREGSHELCDTPRIVEKQERVADAPEDSGLHPVQQDRDKSPCLGRVHAAKPSEDLGGAHVKGVRERLGLVAGRNHCSSWTMPLDTMCGLGHSHSPCSRSPSLTTGLASRLETNMPSFLLSSPGLGSELG